jgi:hypothetical protein
MERLTDRKTADELKAKADGLRALGIELDILDRRYIKLAEYENRDEQRTDEQRTSERIISYNPYMERR